MKLNEGYLFSLFNLYPQGSTGLCHLNVIILTSVTYMYILTPRFSQLAFFTIANVYVHLYKWLSSKVIY